MRTIDATVPELFFVAATRGLAGIGAGLLISEFLGRDERRAIGWTLLAVGAATTVPIALRVFGTRQPPLLAD